MTICKNDAVNVEFTILTHDEKSIIYQHKSSENLSLNSDEPLFEILKVLIGKDKKYQGAFKFEKTTETIPRNGLLKKIDYIEGQIIRFENNPYRYGLITNVSDDQITLETHQPFRRQNLLLKIIVKKVINN